MKIAVFRSSVSQCFARTLFPAPIVLLFFFFPPAIAQNNLGRIHGKITDSITLKPISDVSVFIPFTSIGTITNSNGEYNLGQIPAGEIQIGFRHISYGPRSFLFNLQPGAEIQFNLALAEVTIEIDPVIKRAGEIEWVFGMILFKELFLGDPDEVSCVLKNPQSLHFYYDGDVIYGLARDPLKISNNYLGYDITYYLDYFKFDKNKTPGTSLGANEYFAYGGLSFYTDKAARLNSKKTKWENNRIAEFQGTFRNFLQDLFQDNFWDKQFYLRKVQSDGPDSIFSWDSGQSKGRFIRYHHNQEFALSDSILIDGPGKDEKNLAFSGSLLVFFRISSSENPKGERVCLLDLDNGSLVFDRNGNYRVISGSLNWIYLGNQKRLRNMLPLDYEPNR